MTVFLLLINTESGDHDYAIYKNKPTKKMIDNYLYDYWSDDVDSKTIDIEVKEMDVI